MAAVVGAQQLHFVYLQTDSRKPFYVLLNNKNYSSSSIGYVILPKLQNGDYALRIGFPKSEQTEQEFLVQVKNNDQGFLVKDFGDKGWGLFNLQSMDIQYAGALADKRNQQLAQQKAEEEKRQQEAAAQTAVETQRRADSLQAIALAQKQAQAEAAAQAALRQQRYNDSIQQANLVVNSATDQKAQTEITQRRITDSLQQAADAELANRRKADEEKEQRHITDSLQNVANAANIKIVQEAAQRRRADSVNSVQMAALENERLERLADSTAKAQAAAIERAKQNATGLPSTGNPMLLQKTFTDSGWRYSYSVNGGAGKETVDVFIPVRQPQVAIVAAPVAKEPEVQPTTQPETPVQSTATQSTIAKEQAAETRKEDTKFLDMSFGSNANGTTVVKTDTSGVKVLHNSNCRAMADDKDFLNARKKIAATDGTEKMVAAARKVMKEKCFSTEQIRNLSFLFLTDADRYQFLDAAYPFAVDAYRFSSLQDLLKDDYYVQRFKAMLR